MNVQTIVTGVVAAVVVLAGALFFMGAGQDGADGRNGRDGVGAVVGPEVLTRMQFKSGLSEGGIFTISTTSSAKTLRDAEIKDVKVISIADTGLSAASALALTLPASTSWPSLERAGDYQAWIVDNVRATAATTTTITAGTGVDIDGTTANDDVINGGVSGLLECWRLANTNVRCVVQELVDAG